MGKLVPGRAARVVHYLASMNAAIRASVIAPISSRTPVTATRVCVGFEVSDVRREIARRAIAGDAGAIAALKIFNR